MQVLSSESMFPKFEKFAADHQLLVNAKGSLSAKLPRILGQGKTRADGLDLPPAPIERRQELTSLTLPTELSIPPEVSEEIALVKEQVGNELDILRNPEGTRRFATSVIKELTVPSGVKDNHFYAGRLVLVADKAGQNWSWSLTPYYPVISKIPPDVSYVVQAHAIAERIVEETTLPVEVFHERLALAWIMARHFSNSEDVFISDVARMFKIAVQDQRFWSNPSRRSFIDFPDGSFIANLINWKRRRLISGSLESFEFVPATLNQAHGARSKALFIPANPEGTQVRPIIYLRRVGGKSFTGEVPDGTSQSLRDLG